MVVQEFTYPATTVADAWAVCDPEQPLEPGDPRYLDLTPVRGEPFEESVAGQIQLRVTRTPSGSYHRELFTGHRGGGKSTELMQLQHKLRDGGHFAVYFDIGDVLDPMDVKYLDVLLAIAKEIVLELGNSEIALDQRMLTSLRRWFADTTEIDEKRFDAEAQLDGTIKAGVNFPIISALLTLTSRIKAGATSRDEVRFKVEREIRVFISRLNELIDNASLKLEDAGWKGLVVLVDGLDKMRVDAPPSPETLDRVLFEYHADQLKEPRCHLVYTVPITLLSSINLNNSWSNITVLPMVKTSDLKDNHLTPFPAGRDRLRGLLEKRIDLGAVFEQANDADKLVELSGGVVRDLMRLARYATDHAAPRVASVHVERAISRLVRDYDLILRDSDVEALVQIRRNHRMTRSTPNDIRLLYNRLALEYYNSDTGFWADVHPAVQRLARFRRGFPLESTG